MEKLKQLWNREAEKARIQKTRETSRAGQRGLENLRQWPRPVKEVFYTVVKGLNAWDRENVGSLSPFNAELAAEVAWAEFEKGRK